MSALRKISLSRFLILAGMFCLGGSQGLAEEEGKRSARVSNPVKISGVATDAEKVRPAYWVLSETRVSGKHGDVIYRRTEKPVFPAARPAPPPPATEAFSRELSEELKRRQTKTAVSVVMTGTVWDGRVTELQWWHGGRVYQAFSNIDFSHLMGNPEVTTLETETHVYDCFILVGAETSRVTAAMQRVRAAKGLPLLAEKALPGEEAFPAERSGYVVMNADGVPEKTLEEACVPLEWLHTFYDENRERLVEDYRQRWVMVEKERRLRKLREQKAPEREDTVIYFWPKKSHVSLKK